MKGKSKSMKTKMLAAAAGVALAGCGMTWPDPKYGHGFVSVEDAEPEPAKAEGDGGIDPLEMTEAIKREAERQGLKCDGRMRGSDSMAGMGTLYSSLDCHLGSGAFLGGITYSVMETWMYDQ